MKAGTPLAIAIVLAGSIAASADALRAIPGLAGAAQNHAATLVSALSDLQLAQRLASVKRLAEPVEIAFELQHGVPLVKPKLQTTTNLETAWNSALIANGYAPTTTDRIAIRDAATKLPTAFAGSLATILSAQTACANIASTERAKLTPNELSYFLDNALEPNADAKTQAKLATIGAKIDERPIQACGATLLDIIEIQIPIMQTSAPDVWPLPPMTCTETGTGGGLIRIGTMGNDVYCGTPMVTAFSFDPDGSDEYRNAPGSGIGVPASIGLDLAGVDRYSTMQGIGSVGIGILVEVGANDYFSSGGSMGAAGKGLGFLADLEGNDLFECFNFCLGVANSAGIGILYDAAGDDVYQTERTGMALSNEQGTSLFIDLAGSDDYSVGNEGLGGGQGVGQGGIAFFIDGGQVKDWYRMKGTASNQGFASGNGRGVFADFGGADDYLNNSQGDNDDQWPPAPNNGQARGIDCQSTGTDPISCLTIVTNDD